MADFFPLIPVAGLSYLQNLQMLNDPEAVYFIILL
jgi:hypothetical protein